MTREAYDQVNNWQGHKHEAKLSHEVIAAAASYEAMKAWNDHKERHGESVDHSKAKEIMAGAAGFFIDRLVETKGLDMLDAHKAKEHHHREYRRD